MVASQLSADTIEALQLAGREDLLREYHETLRPVDFWQSRPDNVAEYDEQTGFLESDAKFSICLGGNGAGKTEAAAVKTARYVLDNPPPRPRCPFWIIGDTYDQVCAVCWDEKLSLYIPKDKILNIDWYRPGRNWPFAVTLRHPDNPNEAGWVLEFKSYEQGRKRMTGRSIGGYWFNEEVPLEIVEEVQGRCRDYNSPGWADFTPIEVVSDKWPEKYDKPPDGWRFFHLNSLMNTALAEGWAEGYLASIPEDMRETRRIGIFSTFIGQVFKEWRPSIHVIDPFEIPKSWTRMRGIDFGYNNPTCCLWIAKDRDSRYYVFDEHYRAGMLLADHARIIKDTVTYPQRWWNENHPNCTRTYVDHDAQDRHELDALGVSCTPANKAGGPRGQSAKIRSLMMLQGDGKPKLFVFNTCKNLIREIRGYRWPAGTDNRSPQDNPVDKDNHSLSSLFYAICSDMAGIPRAPTAVRHIWKPREGVRVKL